MTETHHDIDRMKIEESGASGSIRVPFREIAVGLSAEQVETLREALERGRWVLDDTITRQFATALALLPPKREPTLLEAAQDVLTVHADLADGESFRRLRAAIAREEARNP